MTTRGGGAGTRGSDIFLSGSRGWGGEAEEVFVVVVVHGYEHVETLEAFRMDWMDLLAVRETLKCLLQHYSSKASILRRSTFFMA